MAQMRPAIVAGHFSTHHAKAAVDVFVNAIFSMWRMKTRPAAAGIKFGFRTEERGVTTDAAVGTTFMTIPVNASKCALGSFLPGDVIFRFSKLLSPFGFGFLDFGHDDQVSVESEFGFDRHSRL